MHGGAATSEGGAGATALKSTGVTSCWGSGCCCCLCFPRSSICFCSKPEDTIGFHLKGWRFPMAGCNGDSSSSVSEYGSCSGSCSSSSPEDANSGRVSSVGISSAPAELGLWLGWGLGLGLDSTTLGLGLGLVGPAGVGVAVLATETAPVEPAHGNVRPFFRESSISPAATSPPPLPYFPRMQPERPLHFRADLEQPLPRCPSLPQQMEFQH